MNTGLFVVLLILGELVFLVVCFLVAAIASAWKGQDPDLFPCPGCRRYVSRLAKSCPNCGRQFSSEEQN